MMQPLLLLDQCLAEMSWHAALSSSMKANSVQMRFMKL
ncbi:hypothetical protein CSC42_6374 [Pseudomonas aeruginosa]|nr:hypothetical protein CSC42_6374 [Pseudomonas aeruginosa]